MNGTATTPTRRRGRTPARVHGVLPVNKAAGMTSFQVVRDVRRILGERRVGHAGTLDPAALGMLPICVGQATRLVDYFHEQSKSYRCIIRLGQRSTTLDTEGDISDSGDASAVTEDAVRAALQPFVGRIEQTPPMFSAGRSEGRHLYELAREGREIERAPRTVVIESVDLIAFRAGAISEAEVQVVCGKGTYMRVLAADLGDALGTGGLLAWLERTRYGTLALDSAITLDQLAALDDPRSALLSPDVAVEFLPRIDLAPPLALQVQRGQSVWVPNLPSPRPTGPARAHAADGDLIGLGEVQGNLFRPTKILATA